MTATVGGTSVRANDGVEIAYARRPGPGTVPLVLVHGTSAHAGWWEHMLAEFPEHYDVVTMDLAGHGDSGRRAEYSLEGWARDVLAVVRGVFDRPAVLVGHSVGGLVTAAAAVADPGAVAAVVLVDSIVADPPPGRVEPMRAPRPDRVFADLGEVAARFRLAPPQPEADPEILRRIAEGSVREVRGGWAWKVDPSIFLAVGRGGMSAGLADLPGPVAIVRGELSVLVPASAGADLAALIGRPVPQFDVAGAHHHLMIDHPVELAAALREALAVVTPAPRS
jgi:pimeloyl-ACP methyl ester carboxylesterase